MTSDPTEIGSISALWRYPVKSLQGESLDACALSERGLIDDRAWSIYGADGKIGSGKNTRRFRAMARLLELGAKRTPEGVIVHFPGAVSVSGPGPEVDVALSRWLDEPVTLRAEGSVRHHDVKPLHLVSTAALAWLGHSIGDTAPDPRRFRANLLVDLGNGHERPEENLVNRRVAVGTTVLRIVERAERCVMVGTAQRELPSDPRLLRTLAQANNARLGVYSEVETVGIIRSNDIIRLL